jgi:hypothetical protein
VSIVTLLRAVGHVLYKVDAKADADVAYVIEQKWNALKRTRPKPEILWEFIESERNSIVKQYEFGFARTIVVTKPPEGQGGAVIKVDLLSVSGGPLPPQDFPELESLITDGPFRGRPEKEIAQEAIEWWDKCLDDIEKLVAQRKASNQRPA